MIAKIHPGDPALDATKEPYCEMVSFTFIHGPARRSHTCNIPLRSFNCEVSSPEYTIPRLPVSLEPMSIKIQLPEWDIPWDEAIKLLTNYLLPRHKNNKRVTDSPIIPIDVTPRVLLPLFWLASRLHMDDFAQVLVEEVQDSQCAHAVPIVQQIARFNIDGIPFVDSLIDKLSEALPSLRPQTFGGIEMAPVILTVLERAKPEKDPISVVEWLYITLSKFIETRAFEAEITGVINSLYCTDSYCAFICWSYGCFIDGLANATKFEALADQFNFQKMETTFVLPVQNVIWLIDKLRPNETKRDRLRDLICRWMRTNNTSGKEDLFNYAVDYGLLDFTKLSGADLCSLLSFAYKHSSQIFSTVVEEIKSDINRWRGSLSIKNRDLVSIDWGSLLACFDLRTPPRIPEWVKVDTETRNLFRALDSIFYHWILANVQRVTPQIIRSYLGLDSTRYSHMRSHHRRLMIIDVLNRMDPVDVALRNDIVAEFIQWADFGTVLTALLLKNDLNLSEKTLEFMHSKCNGSASLMTQLTHLIERMSDVEGVANLIIPVNEISVSSALRIISRVSNLSVFVRENVLDMVRLVIGTLSTSDLQEAMKTFTFEEMFVTPRANTMLLYDEDIALFYALLRDEIDPSGEPSPGIYWPHVSLRAMALVTGDPAVNLEFQFDLEEDSVLNCMKKAPLPLEPWRQCAPPRVGTYTNLATLPPSRVMIYVLAEQNSNTDECIETIMKFIGIHEFAIQYVNESSQIDLSYEVHVLYMPNDTIFELDYSFLLDSIIDLGYPIPLVVNANTAIQIQQTFHEKWKRIVGVETDLHDYDVSSDPYLTWNEPSPTMLPRKQDLFRVPLVNGADPLFNTIPCSSGHMQKWRARLEWKNGRIVGGAIFGSSVSIINCDLVISNTPPHVIDPWIKVKLTAQCLLSLMCESIAGTVPVLSGYK